MIEQETKRPRSKMASDFVPDDVVSPKLSDQTTRTTSKLLKSLNVNDDAQFSSSSSNIQILGALYALMVKIESNRQKLSQLDENRKEEYDNEDLRRHKEILKALTVRRMGPKKKKETGKESQKELKKDEKEVPKEEGILPNFVQKSKELASKVKGKITGQTVSKVQPTVTGQTAAKVATTAAVGLGGLSIAKTVGAAEGGGAGYDAAFGDRMENGKIVNIIGLKTAEQYSGKKLSEMTLAEVKDFQKYRNKTKKNTGAVGKYQFVASTLDGVIKEMNLPMDAKFTPKLQDEMNEHFYRGNEAYLKRNGVTPTPGNMYMAHYIGPAGAVAVNRAAKNGEDVTVRDAMVKAKLNDPKEQNPELTTIKVKDFESILQTRLVSKGLKIETIPSIPVTGTQLDISSKDRKDMIEAMQEFTSIQQIINNTNVGVNSSQASQYEKSGNDSSVYQQKKDRNK
jgi:hypothetical protein